MLESWGRSESDGNSLRESLADLLEQSIFYLIEFQGQLIADSTPFATNAAALGQSIVNQVFQNFAQNVLLFQKGRKRIV